MRFRFDAVISNADAVLKMRQMEGIMQSLAYIGIRGITKSVKIANFTNDFFCNMINKRYYSSNTGRVPLHSYNLRKNIYIIKIV